MEGSLCNWNSLRRKLGFLRELGADEVIDYKKENFWEKVNDVDLVIDLIGGETQQKSLQVVRSVGRIVTTTGPKYTEEAQEKNIRLIGFMAASIPSHLERIASLIDEGKIKPVISKVMPLEKAAEAQDKSQYRHPRGKIILKVK